MHFRSIFSFHKKMEDRVRAHIAYNICLLILSILISIFYQYINYNNILLGNNPDYVNWVIAFISHGLFFIAIICLIGDIKLLRNKEKMHQVEIEENDERNQLITMKAYAYTCRGTIIGCFIVSLISVFDSIYLSQCLAIVGICMIVAVFFITRFLQKRM